MLRDEAVARIHNNLGYRPLGTSLQGGVETRLQRAQEYMEQGKSLPWFLLQLDATFTLFVGNSAFALPVGFIRESDESRLHVLGSSPIHYLSRRYTIDGMQAYQLATDSIMPSVYAIRRQMNATPAPGVKTTPSPGVVEFFRTFGQNYTFEWDYYKKDAPLTSNIENNWLREAPEVLIGLAGASVAHDLHNTEAEQGFVQLFQDRYKALFGEMIAQEEASQPLQMGANL